MPNPKRRHSRGRGKRRRTHWKVTPMGLTVCPKCSSPKQPHRVCLVCGTYNGRLVMDFEADKAKKAEKKKKKKSR
jgi:large subunit ribosomal protein L32